MNASAGLVVRTWNDAPISRRDGDGFADATAMCRANGKDLFDYQRLDRTAAYIQALADSLGTPADQLVISTTTGPNHLRGTWVHPRLAVDLARWLSPQFAVWMDGWFLEQVQQQRPAAHYYLPRRRSRKRPLAAGADVTSLVQLWPSERAVATELHYRSLHGGPCRTSSLEAYFTALEEWRAGTIRSAIARLRNRGLVVKRGPVWQLTPLGVRLTDLDAPGAA